MNWNLTVNKQNINQVARVCFLFLWEKSNCSFYFLYFKIKQTLEVQIEKSISYAHTEIVRILFHTSSIHCKHIYFYFYGQRLKKMHLHLCLFGWLSILAELWKCKLKSGFFTFVSLLSLTTVISSPHHRMQKALSITQKFENGQTYHLNLA